MKLDAVQDRLAHRQTQISKAIHGKNPQVGEIVNGENARRIQPRVLGHVDGRQSGVPVVCMDIIRPPVRVEFSRSHMRGNPTQESKTAMIIAPVGTIRADINIALTLIEE